MIGSTLGGRVVGDGSYLTPAEVSALIGDSRMTVSRLFDDEQLDGYTTERGGHRRISAVSVARLLLRRDPSPERDGALELLRQSGVDLEAVARSLGD